MSSAHDLPTSTSPEVLADGPHLKLVPVLPEGAPAGFDLDVALAEATPQLQRYATRRLGSSHEAEEVVQEALLRAYQHRAAFATVDDLMAWSTVVTGRLVIDRVRVRARSVSVAEVPESKRMGRDTAEVVVARDEARLALDALESMPTRQAAVLWAREVEGQSYDEIADRYGLSEPTVRSLLHRARKTLRREYAARGGTLPVGGLVVLAPWLTSLRGLSRLRASLRRAAVSGATLSIAGLSAIAAIGLAPGVPAPDANGAHGRPLVRMPDSAPAVISVPVPARHSAAVLGTRSGAAPGPASVADKVATALPRVCNTGTKFSAGCAKPGATTLYIGPELPDNPTGVRRVGVYMDDAQCNELPDTPVTECAPSKP